MRNAKTIRPSETSFLKTWLMSALKYGPMLTQRQMETSLTRLKEHRYLLTDERCRVANPGLLGQRAA